MRRTGVALCLIVISSTLVLGWPSASAAAEDVAAAFTGGPGDTPELRTKAIIARLDRETLDDSLANIDYVDDYYYPGYYPDSIMAGPYEEEVRVVLSNRRVGKIFAAMKQLPSDQQFALLQKHFSRLLEQYKGIVLKFKKGAPMTREDNELFIRISEVPGKPRTAAGTRHALRALALISGALGNTRMWPALKGAFANGVYGTAINEQDLDASALQSFKEQPVFGCGLQAGIAWLMARYSDDTSAAGVGFNRKAVINLVVAYASEFSSMPYTSALAASLAKSRGITRAVNLPSYKSPTTAYDVGSGGVEDLSYGSARVEFLITPDQDKLGAIAKAAGL